MVSRQGETLDHDSTRFGIRDVQFDPERGVHVNGERVYVQGVNQHHDLGALGAAFNTRAAERQLETLRAMSCNAIRRAHNPPAPELLRESMSAPNSDRAATYPALANIRQTALQVAERVGHACMPGRIARHLRCMIGDDDAVEAVCTENGENSRHVDISIVNELLVVVGCLTADVAKVYVGDSSVSTQCVGRFVHVALGHFSHGANAKFDRVGRAWRDIQQSLKQVGLVNQSWLPAHGW